MDAAQTENSEKIGGAFADALTFVRAALTPVIMFVIIKAWSGQADDPAGYVSFDLGLACLASFLFAIAAMTDFLDDFVGGSQSATYRLFGWFDDISDSILIAGTLLALIYVTHKSQMLHWTLWLPAAIYIGRDFVLGVVKGYEFSKQGFAETRLGDIKNVLAMGGAMILVASPWLNNVVQRLFASDENPMAIYDSSAALVWNSGIAIIVIAAILSVVTAVQLLAERPRGEG